MTSFDIENLLRCKTCNEKIAGREYYRYRSADYEGAVCQHCYLDLLQDVHESDCSPSKTARSMCPLCCETGVFLSHVSFTEAGYRYTSVDLCEVCFDERL